MRADLYLVERGYFATRTQAQHAISAGTVAIDGQILRKASAPLDGDHDVVIGERMPYVSRGGLKLEGALDRFCVDVSGFRALDIGASTGGFTDCLLQRGAIHVTALDAGEGQLHPTLRADRRVTCLEHVNARELQAPPLLPPYDIAVMDVSFISQTYILPQIPRHLTENGRLISLIKPQFEAGRSAIGRGGLVRREDDRMAAIRRVLVCAAEHGLACIGLMPSPITGGDGNVEYLALFARQADAVLPDTSEIRRMLDVKEQKEGMLR